MTARPLIGPSHAAANPTADALGGELERLRAEVRELKFSLGSLYGRVHVAANAGHDRAPLSAAASDNDAAVCDSPYFETYLEMTATGLAPELARRAERAKRPALLIGADARKPYRLFGSRKPAGRGMKARQKAERNFW